MATISHDNNNHRIRKHASTSWRSDGSPSCLGGSSHGWVLVTIHSTPVHTSMGRLWVAHRHRNTTTMSQKRNTMTTRRLGRKLQAEASLHRKEDGEIFLSLQKKRNSYGAAVRESFQPSLDRRDRVSLAYLREETGRRWTHQKHHTHLGKRVKNLDAAKNCRLLCEW